QYFVPFRIWVFNLVPFVVVCVFAFIVKRFRVFRAPLQMQTCAGFIESAPSVFSPAFGNFYQTNFITLARNQPHASGMLLGGQLRLGKS
ncbi:hypothetical protein AAHB49_09370, partial [Bacillus cereus]